MDAVTNDDFWGTPLASGRAVLAELVSRGAYGLELAAPRMVGLDARDTLPVVAAQLAATSTLHSRRFRDQLVAVAVDVDRDEVFAAPVFEPKQAIVPRPRLPLPPASRAETAPRDATMASFDLRARLGLPWRPADLRVGLILLDEVSHRATVRLDWSRDVYVDPVVPGVLKERAAGGVRSFAVRVDSDPTGAVPGTAGILLALDRVIALRPGARAWLRGGVRLPAPVTPRDDLTVTLVVIGGETTHVAVLPLSVPVRERPGGHVTAAFIVDLLSLPGFSPRPQAHFVYAFAGDVAAGPALVTLVPEDHVPAGVA